MTSCRISLHFFIILNPICIQVYSSADIKKREHLSSIAYGSYINEKVEVENKNENILCGRDWIEDHLNYERRYHITDKEIDSAAEFRRQNARECQVKSNLTMHLFDKCTYIFS